MSLDRATAENRPYIVIYPRGVRSKLDVAYVRVFERDRWDLASNESFTSEEEAKDYARILSRRSGLPLAFRVPLIIDAPHDDGGGPRLFRWQSHARCGICPGQILVLARSVEDARAHVRRHFEIEIVAGPDQRRILEEDLARAPEILHEGAVCLPSRLS